MASAKLNELCRYVVALASSIRVVEPADRAVDNPTARGCERRIAISVLQAKLRVHFNKTQVEGIIGNNWLDFLERSLPNR